MMITVMNLIEKCNNWDNSSLHKWIIISVTNSEYILPVTAHLGSHLNQNHHPNLSPVHQSPVNMGNGALNKVTLQVAVRQVMATISGHHAHHFNMEISFLMSHRGI